MSFSSDVKHEITSMPLQGGQARALLCSVFLVRASLNFSSAGSYIAFQTENAAIAKFIYQILRAEFDADVVLSVMKKMNLKKNNVYRIQIYGQATQILEELTILREGGLCETPLNSMIRSEKNARAFLQGIFLACGSINHPKSSSYHLEMSVPSEGLAVMTVKLMERFYIPAKITTRKGNYIIYTKVGEKIADFLRVCSATQSLLNFEDFRIQRDFYNQLTRLDNCEVANEMKTLKAAQEQLAWIEAIEKSSSCKVPEKIAHVMEARKQNPEASVVELCDVVYALYGEVISKSGMKHRLSKLKEMAAGLEGTRGEEAHEKQS